ncbi:pre-peptidase C-terminal domain-containing protein [Rhodanobacter ginsengisoli]|uniref:Pre-peptidase C-terminal domain-containing protein n=1 Tax=Rhodanobacter ginsengisoli TaxID=418646 RepID=A0ABW0QSH4_9GAMM
MSRYLKRNLLNVFAVSALLGLTAGAAMASSGSELAPQTQNPYAPAYGHAYRHGAVPTREAHGRMKQYQSLHAASTAAATGSKTLSYGGGVDGIGVTSGTPKVYIVVYGSQWGTAGTDGSGNTTVSNDPVGAVPYMQKLFKNLGTGSELWSGVLTQYCDGPLVSSGATFCPSGAPHVGYPTGGAFAGIWYDNSVSSPSNATGAQLAQEAIKAAQHFGNTTAASNRYVQYVILSPTGTHPDGFNTSSGQFCAWHDWNGDQSVSSPVGDVAFTNMPYVYDMGTSCGMGSVNGNTAQGKLDGFSIVEGHEYAETVSDQNPAGGWTNHVSGSASNGQENGDECAWISSGQGATANVVMGSGTFPMQSTWSNDTNECDISHPIVGGGGGGNVPPVANFSDTISGLTVNFTDSSTDSDGSIASRSWNFGDSSTSTATNPSHTYAAAGTYSVALTVTDNSGATNTKTQSVTVSSGGGGGNVLQNGVALTGQAGATGAQLFYTVVIPAGASNLVISTSGGTGDADLYTKFGSNPTLSSYDCRPYITGNNESCTVASPQAGTYYVMLNGYAAFSGVSIKATWSTGGGGGGNVLSNGVAATGLSATTGNSVAYTMVVPAGATNLKFVISGSSGDADLYVKFGSAPTTSSYDCRPYLTGDNETCTISNVQAGTYYVMVRAYQSYSGVSLTGSYTP